MNWKAYSTQALETAIYPNKFKIVYPTMGLVGELGELTSKLQIPFPDSLGIAHEIGDCLWYINALCNDLNIVAHIIFINADRDAKDVSASEMRFYTSILDNLGIAAERIKKHLRDDIALDIHGVGLAMSNIVTMLFYLGAWHKYTPLEIAELNISKLSSRKKRGKIHGEGDHR